MRWTWHRSKSPGFDAKTITGRSFHVTVTSVVDVKAIRSIIKAKDYQVLQRYLHLDFEVDIRLLEPTHCLRIYYVKHIATGVPCSLRTWSTTKYRSLVFLPQH